MRTLWVGDDKDGIFVIDSYVYAGVRGGGWADDADKDRGMLGGVRIEWGESKLGGYSEGRERVL